MVLGKKGAACFLFYVFTQRHFHLFKLLEETNYFKCVMAKMIDFVRMETHKHIFI